MVKNKSIFVCQSCGAEYPKWQGRCNQCGQWNSLVEEVIEGQKTSSLGPKVKKGRVKKPLKFSKVRSKELLRIKIGIVELNRVLGGGIVPGSLVLLAGSPGIGKSTLLTQLALDLGKVSKTKSKKKKSKKSLNSILYICGEESPSQVKIRIKRLTDKKQSVVENLLFLPETKIEDILSTIKSFASRIDLIIVDSIQSLWTERLTGSAGTVGQVRHCSNILLNIAKITNIPVILIGHVTKEGSIAGPKVLEHLVDTVLYLEGDEKHDFRILRTTKNRFGPTDEVGVFQMTDKGMKEIKNPADIFLEQRKEKSPPGSAVVVTMQGIRPMLVEIQALVVSSQLAIPRRVASGIDRKRLQVLSAVLQKRAGLRLASQDIFVSVTGGLKLTEPAVDLGISLAIVSSLKNKPLPSKSVCIGEVGLLGEIRKVSFIKKRLKEAEKLGYKTIIGQKEKTLRQTFKYF